jgi:hypothetical protein
VRRSLSDLGIDDDREKKKLKIDVKWRPSDNREENRAFMVITKELPRLVWNTNLSLRETLDRQMEEAKYPQAKVSIHDLVVEDSDQHVLFANTRAGDVIEKLSARVEELQETIEILQARRAEDNRIANERRAEENRIKNERRAEEKRIANERLKHQQREDEQLRITKQDQNSLMIRQLHQRFRTVWQIAQNLGYFEDIANTSKIGSQSLAGVFKNLGGWDLHRKRYTLCTALGHGGDLKSDLLVGTSGYLATWHDSPDHAAHAIQSEALYTRLFSLIYRMDYTEAQWIGKTIHDIPTLHHLESGY